MDKMIVCWLGVVYFNILDRTCRLQMLLRRPTSEEFNVDSSSTISNSGRALGDSVVHEGGVVATLSLTAMSEKMSVVAKEKSGSPFNTLRCSFAQLQSSFGPCLAWYCSADSGKTSSCSCRPNACSSVRSVRGTFASAQRKMHIEDVVHV